MMKKIILLAVTLICINFTVLNVFADVVPYYSGSSGIDDKASIYTSSQITSLEKIQTELAEKTGWNIAVVTTTTGFGENNSKRAHNYCHEYYVNTFGQDSSGVVFLIDLDIRTIYAHGDARDILTLSRLDNILDKTEEYYFDYDDVGNLETFYSQVLYYYNAGKPSQNGGVTYNGNNSYTVNTGSSGNDVTGTRLLIAFGFGLAAAIISIVVIVSKYKFHHKPTANNYMNKNSLNMYIRKDNYVREYTTRTRIHDDSSSSGGGSSGGHSHHSSGGGHSSSHGGRR